VIELTTARDLMSQECQEVNLPAFPTLVLRRGALVLLVGAAGSGKSTLAARALDSMQALTLLVSVEEPPGDSLKERLRRIAAKDERLLVCSHATVDEIADVVRQRKVAALAVDSIQRAVFEARDLRHWLRVLPSLELVIAVSQINRNGDVRGGEVLSHEADVVIEVADLHWTILKSRYQPIGASGSVLSTPPAPSEDQHVPA
jgi:predicted ATP-dependent serine protease